MHFWGLVVGITRGLGGDYAGITRGLAEISRGLMGIGDYFKKVQILQQLMQLLTAKTR